MRLLVSKSEKLLMLMLAIWQLQKLKYSTFENKPKARKTLVCKSAASVAQWLCLTFYYSNLLELYQTGIWRPKVECSEFESNFKDAKLILQIRTETTKAKHSE